MATTCPVCGTEAASDTARHCHECGAPLEGPTPGEPTSGASPPNPPPPPSRAPDNSPHRPAEHPSGLTGETRNWAMAAHLSAFLGAWVALAFVGPLVVWLIKREEDPFVERHAREALNFNLNLVMWLGIGFIVVILTLGLGILVVLPLALAIGITWLVLTIIASVRAANGEPYRYPLTIRFVS